MRIPTAPLRPRLLGPFLTLTLALAACGAAPAPSPTVPPTGGLGSPAAGSPSAGAPSASAGLTPVPGGPTPTPTPAPATPVSTTSTDWGVIQDVLPRAFPIFPGSHEAQPLEAASGAFTVPADGQTTTAWYQAALKTAGFTTLVSGPFENGETMIDSVGEAPGCKVQTKIQPQSGTTLVTVLYGAACPP
jgi:hypothetical protein